jgi:predicted metal-dependent hydrolase
MMARAAMQVEQTMNYLLHEDSAYKSIGEKARRFLQSWKSGGIKERLNVIDMNKDVEPNILKEQLEAFDKVGSCNFDEYLQEPWMFH